MASQSHGFDFDALVELDEMMARYGSYENLAKIVRHGFNAPKQMLWELFSRMLLTVFCGNSDDYARNARCVLGGACLRLRPTIFVRRTRPVGKRPTHVHLWTRLQKSGRRMLEGWSARIVVQSSGISLQLQTV